MEFPVKYVNVCTYMYQTKVQIAEPVEQTGYTVHVYI